MIKPDITIQKSLLILAKKFSLDHMRTATKNYRQEKRFSDKLKLAVNNVLYPFLGDVADKLVQNLNKIGHNLSLESMGSSTDLCVRYTRLSATEQGERPYDFLVAFDLHVSVFFAEGKTDFSRPTPMSFGHIATGIFDFDNYFSRAAFDMLRPDPSALKKRCNELQDVLEEGMCNELKPAVNAIVRGLNSEGYKFEDLKSCIPEIDFRDMDSGLHIGLYCIATIDSK